VFELFPNSYYIAAYAAERVAVNQDQTQLMYEYMENDFHGQFLRYTDSLIEVSALYGTIETVLEAGPQVFLQIYIFMNRIETMSLEAGSIILKTPINTISPE